MDHKYIHYFTIVFGAIINLYIFRMQCLIIFVLSISNYILVVKLVDNRRFYLIVHSFNFLQIVLIRYFELEFGTFSQQLKDWTIEILGTPVLEYHVFYNLNVLRQVSYALEYHYVLNQGKNQNYRFLINYQKNIEKHINTCNDC